MILGKVVAGLAALSTTSCGKKPMWPGIQTREMRESAEIAPTKDRDIIWPLKPNTRLKQHLHSLEHALRWLNKVIAHSRVTQPSLLISSSSNGRLDVGQNRSSRTPRFRQRVEKPQGISAKQDIANENTFGIREYSSPRHVP